MFSVSDYRTPNHWQRIHTIDMHTGGEPLRVILEGFPKPVGNNVLEYRQYFKQHQDHLRTALMFEPRGHADMYGVIITPSKTADFGAVFIHNEGYSTMCGHATIALGKLAVESGWVAVTEPETRLTIEAPCGLLNVRVEVANGEVGGVSFENVPSFVVALDEEVFVEGIGAVRYDLAYGGAFYAYVQAGDFGLECTPTYAQQFIDLGRRIKESVINQKSNIVHPEEQDLSFLYGTIFIGPGKAAGTHSSNVCIFADGELDRSPTGSGVSGRLAIHHRRGEVEVGDDIRIESILGSYFDCQVLAQADFHGYSSVRPEVTGTAHITGVNELIIDPSDPLKHGFLVR